MNYLHSAVLNKIWQTKFTATRRLVIKTRRLMNIKIALSTLCLCYLSLVGKIISHQTSGNKNQTSDDHEFCLIRVGFSICQTLLNIYTHTLFLLLTNPHFRKFLNLKNPNSQIHGSKIKEILFKKKDYGRKFLLSIHCNSGANRRMALS